MAERKLAVIFTGDPKGATRAMGEVEKAGGGLMSKLSKVGGGITTAFKGAAIGSGLLGGGLIAFGGDLLTSGAEVAAWRQKTGVVFEGQAADVRAWADKNNEAFGLTDDELAGLAASFGDLLKPMGFTADQAADMSTKVVGLSGALSSWSGGKVSAAEASDILAKAMLGERDGLKSLGISISEADVQARLAAKGQDKLTGAALEQAKAVATQELIFEKSTDAQKAWADGGNKALLGQNKLKAGIAELKETLATALTPVLASVAGWLGDRIPGAMAGAKALFDRVRPSLDTVAAGFSRVVEAVSPVVNRVREFFANDPDARFAALATVLGGVVLAAVVSLGTALVALFSPVYLVVGAVALLAAGVIYAYRHFEGFRGVVDGVVGWLTGTAWPAVQAFAGLVADGFGVLVGWVQAHWGQIKGYISGAIRTVATVVGGVIDGIKLAWQTWGDEILTIARTYWGYIKGTVENGIKLVKSVIDVVMGVIRGDWSRVWDGLRGIAGAVWDQIKLAAETGLKVLGAVISAAWDGIKLVAREAWDAFKRTVSSAIDGAVEFVRKLPGRIVAAIGDLNDLLLQAGKDVIAGLVRGITESIPSVSGVLGGITDMIPDWKGPAERDRTLLKPAGEKIMAGLVAGIESGVPALMGSLRNITAMIGRAADDNVAAFWRAQSMINSLSPGAQSNPDGSFSQWWVGTKYESSEYAKWIDALRRFFAGGGTGPSRPSDGAKSFPGTAAFSSAAGGGQTVVQVTVQGSLVHERDLPVFIADALNQGARAQARPLLDAGVTSLARR